LRSASNSAVRDELETLGMCAHERTLAKRDDADPARTLLNWIETAAAWGLAQPSPANQ
jgi:hypothetical protein